HAEDGRALPEAADDVGRNPRLPRRARSGGDDDMRWPRRLDCLERRGVVASYDGLFSQLAHVAGQVVDERVVVVDQQDHGTRAAMSPPALSSVSRYSCSGSESATMPPPTWKYTSRPSTRQVRITMLVSSAPASAASCSGESPRGRVPLIGRVSTRPPGSARRKRSGDELATTTFPKSR